MPPEGEHGATDASVGLSTAKPAASASDLEDALASAETGEGLFSDLDRLLSININTSAQVDAANLQKVLTFVVAGVQTLAGAEMQNQAAMAEMRDTVAATKERIDALDGTVKAAAGDSR